MDKLKRFEEFWARVASDGDLRERLIQDPDGVLQREVGLDVTEAQNLYANMSDDELNAVAAGSKGTYVCPTCPATFDDLNKRFMHIIFECNWQRHVDRARRNLPGGGRS